MRVLLLNGPNLNMLGTREMSIYGAENLEAINSSLMKLAESLDVEMSTQQSNAEHVLIDAIQISPKNRVEFIIINPAGLTHSSIALRDALLAVSIPFIEVHLSNTKAREPFRHHSYLSDIAMGVIMGLGPFGYECALRSAVSYLSKGRQVK